MLRRRRRAWELPESAVTPEHVYLNRRELLRAIGLGAASLTLGCQLQVSGEGSPPTPEIPASGCEETYDSVRSNARYKVDHCLTPFALATQYNNYYEFSTKKQEVAQLAAGFGLDPWVLQVGGLVRNPRHYEVKELLKLMPVEERVYRFRCVEAWSMTVPWTGFPLAALIAAADPLPGATHVRFETALLPEVMVGLSTLPTHPWPYREGLTLAEATNELAFLATGIYGRQLPGQNGGRIRLVVPWKYGFKSIKSLIRIDLVDAEPATFWNTAWPAAYDFRSNVNPLVAHPLWSQANERVLGTQEIIPTQPLNGYGELVGHLY